MIERIYTENFSWLYVVGEEYSVGEDRAKLKLNSINDATYWNTGQGQKGAFPHFILDFGGQKFVDVYPSTTVFVER